MSALLSPPPPVRTRFKVPGEGSYELCADLPPPPPPTFPTPPPASTPPTKPSPPNSSTPTPPPQPSYTAGPLGLPKVTKLSFAQHATLQTTSTPPVVQETTPTASPRTPSQTGVPSMFSLRKLTGLGSSISAKFGGGEVEESLQTNLGITASPRNEEGVPRFPPRVAAPRVMNKGCGNVGGVLAYNASENVVLVDVQGQMDGNEQTITLQTKSPACVQALYLMGDGLRLLVGCVNGEVVYYPDVAAMDGKKLKEKGGIVYNKEGGLNSNRVVEVYWVPGSSFRFLSVHVDGGIVIYDSRFKPSQVSLRSNVQQNVGNGTQESGVEGVTCGLGNMNLGERGGSGEKEREKNGISITDKSKIRMGNGNMLGQHDIVVMRQQKGRRNNPVSIWQVGRSAVTSCEFSPVVNMEGSRLLAVTGRDGYLRILDFVREVPIAAFRSYFGAFLCCSWSPDGKYVATGGEDDLVSIWCPAEERLVARLEGHTSWVSAVAWDESLSAPGRYRIGSAGQDAKLLLWDFALDVLHHPSPQSRLGMGVVRLRSYVREGNSVSNGGGIGNGSVSSNSVERKTSKLSRLRGHATSSQQEQEGQMSVSTPVGTPVVVGALGRAEVPIVEPVVAHVAHGEPLTDVWFQDGGVFTADCAGVVKMWSRPAAHAVPVLTLEASSATEGTAEAAAAVARKGIASDLD